MKRFLSIFTALCLTLALAVPALAAETPDWDELLGKGASPCLCETGKDHILYDSNIYAPFFTLYRSADGMAWAKLERQWGGGSPCIWRGHQWIGPQGV